MLQNFLQEGDPWMLGEDIPNCDFFFSSLWLHCFVNYFEKHTGRAYSKILCKYEGYHLWFYFGEQDSSEVGENIVNKITHENAYAAKVNKNIIKQADILRKFSEKIPQRNLEKLDNTELWRIYEKHLELHQEYYTWCWIPVAADMFHNNLTKRVKKYLVDIGVPEDKLNEYFITLTQPTKKSLIFIEQEELLNIATKIEKDRELCKLFQAGKVTQEALPHGIERLIERYHKKYYYTKHLWVEGEYTIDDYLEQLKEILQGGVSAEKSLAKMNHELNNNRQQKKQLFRELEMDAKWQKIFNAFGDFMITKIFRRYPQILAVHHMSAILKEIARRNFITEKQVRFMLPTEVRELLLNNVLHSEELLERTKLCVYYADKNNDKIFVKNEAVEIMKKIKQNVDTEVRELKGDIGCPGQAKGKVKIIIRAEDMKKMEDGDILVSIATDPDIVPAMKKAAAIITEQGGVTSHAAIVSRELGIPCVIGTKISTRVLKDGDLVEVDATKGIINLLS